MHIYVVLCNSVVIQMQRVTSTCVVGGVAEIKFNQIVFVSLPHSVLLCKRAAIIILVALLSSLLFLIAPCLI